MRLEAWNRLARELDHDKLAAMTSTIPLDGVIEAGQEIVAGRIKGRVVVEIGLTTLRHVMAGAAGHPEYGKSHHALDVDPPCRSCGAGMT